MKLAVVSDLHLEINGLRFKEFGEADILIIAGDFLTARHLPEKQTDAEARSIKRACDHYKEHVFPKYRRVFFVKGNHEPYGYNYFETEPTIQQYFSDCPNFVVMENTTEMVDGIHFIGCTLWSDFFGGEPTAMEIARRNMNDYKIIYTSKFRNKHYVTEDQILKPDHTLNWHIQSRKFIDAKAKEYPNAKTVVITHHAPTMQSVAQAYRGDILNGAYASDLSSLMEARPNIGLWIHGHTHNSCDYIVYNTRVYSNQMGYNFEHQSQAFDPKKVIEI